MKSVTFKHSVCKLTEGNWGSQLASQLTITLSCGVRNANQQTGRSLHFANFFPSWQEVATSLVKGTSLNQYPMSMNLFNRRVLDV